MSMPPPRSAPGGGGGGGHSRKSSLAGKSAFASTDKAKKLGFFKRRGKSQPFVPGGYPSGEGGDESLMETRSMVTWITKGESKCSIM